MAKMKRAVVAGSIGLDIIPVFPQSASSELSSLFAQGKFTDMGGTRLYLGGCVGNTGIAMHKLGVPVTLVSKVGDDLLGQVIRVILKKQQVPIHIDTAEGCNSTSTVVIAPFGGDRVLLHSRGASQTFLAEDVDLTLLKKADLLHFGYPTAMKYLYRDGGKEFIRLVRRAKESGVTVSVDTSQPDPNSEAGHVNWREVLKQAMPSIDVFLPSLEELLFMLRREQFDELERCRGKESLADDVDFSIIPELAQELISWGAKIVVIKLGKRGMYLRTTGREELGRLGRALPDPLEAWVNRELLCPPYHTDQICSTTGAGDNAIAGFLAAMLRNDQPEHALLIASANARLCIESYETTDAVRPLPDLDKWIATQPIQESIGKLPGQWKMRSKDGIFFKSA